MPFSAKLNSKTYISTLCSDEEWEDLKQASRNGQLDISWSNQPCIPRTSKLGTRHFAHRRNVHLPEGLSWSESPEHLFLKSQVIKAACELGWEASTEVPSQDRSWIADTLLKKDGRTIAVEIQWSRQSASEYVRRQRRYEKEGIECFWISRHDYSDSERGSVQVPSICAKQSRNYSRCKLYSNNRRQLLSEHTGFGQELSGRQYPKSGSPIRIRIVLLLL